MGIKDLLPPPPWEGPPVPAAWLRSETIRLLGGSAERIGWAKQALRKVLTMYRLEMGAAFPWSNQLLEIFDCLSKAKDELTEIIIALEKRRD